MCHEISGWTSVNRFTVLLDLSHRCYCCAITIAICSWNSHTKARALSRFVEDESLREMDESLREILDGGREKSGITCAWGRYQRDGPENAKRTSKIYAEATNKKIHANDICDRPKKPTRFAGLASAHFVLRMFVPIFDINCYDQSLH